MNNVNRTQSALCTGGAVTSLIKEEQKCTHTYNVHNTYILFNKKLNNRPSQRAFSDKTIFTDISFSKQLMKDIKLHICKLYKIYYIYKFHISIKRQIQIGNQNVKNVKYAYLNYYI